MFAELGQNWNQIPRMIQNVEPGDLNAIVVTYVDGTRGYVLKYGQSSGRWNFACRMQGQAEPVTTTFHPGPWGNRNLFAALSHSIQHLFRTGQPPYPVERTLLVSGALDAVMHSHADGDQPLATPHLQFGYVATDFRRFREDGRSWEIITTTTPEKTTFDPGVPEGVQSPVPGGT